MSSFWDQSVSRGNSAIAFSTVDLWKSLLGSVSSTGQAASYVSFSCPVSWQHRPMHMLEHPGLYISSSCACTKAVAMSATPATASKHLHSISDLASYSGTNNSHTDEMATIFIANWTHDASQAFEERTTFFRKKKPITVISFSTMPNHLFFRRLGPINLYFLLVIYCPLHTEIIDAISF